VLLADATFQGRAAVAGTTSYLRLLKGYLVVDLSAVLVIMDISESAGS